MSGYSGNLRTWAFVTIILVLIGTGLNVMAIFASSNTGVLLLWLGFSSIVMAIVCWRVSSSVAIDRFLAFPVGVATVNLWLAFLYLVGNVLEPSQWNSLAVPLGFLTVSVLDMVLFAFFFMQGSGPSAVQYRRRQRWLTVILIPAFYLVGLLVVSLV